MKITEIILEGFKSYGSRTTLERLDHEFTAITGLNGSGKSNILDAICFVLGLQSLGLARASKIQDLIYKSGQAGIKEASVTISFDNSDKSKSPIGYSNVNKINVTRKIVKDTSKCYVNGSVVTTSNCKRMFKSIGLNIDHPETFFVQQGKITKIVNFKPLDILEMLMESAGVAYYKEVSEQTKNVMKDKVGKLENTQDRMKTNFGPRLKALEKERAKIGQFDYLKKAIIEDRDLIHKLVNYKAKKAFITGKQSLLEAQAQRENLKSLKQQLDLELANLKKKNPKAARDNFDSTSTNEEIALLKEKKTEIDRKKALTKNELQNDQKKLSKKLEELTELKTKESDDTAKLESSKVSIESKKAALKKLQSKINELEAERSEFSAPNITSKDSATQPLKDAIKQSETNIASMREKVQTHKAGLKQIEKELKQSESSSLTLEDDIRKDKEELEVLKKAVGDASSMDAEYKRVEINELAPKQNALNAILKAERDYKEKCLENNIRTHEFTFNYRNPTPDFNRKLIKGKAFTLVRIKPEFIRAVEAGSGARLLNIVAENDDVVKLFLENKCTDGYTAYAPMNRLKSYQLPQQVVDNANRIAAKHNSKVYLPHEDVISPILPDFQKIVSFLSRGYLICPSLDACSEISSCGPLAIKCVTLEGDSFDPAGLVSGGFSAPKDSIITRFCRFKELGDAFAHKINMKDQAEKDVKDVQNKLAEMRAKRDEISRKLEKVEQLTRKIQSATANPYKTMVQTLKQKEALLKALCDEDLEEIAKLEKSISGNKQLLQKISKGQNIKQDIQKKLESTEEEIKEAKSCIKTNQQEIYNFEAEITQLTKNLQEYSKRNQTIDESIKKLQIEIKSRERLFLEEESQFEEIFKEISDKEAVLQKKKEKDMQEEAGRKELYQNLEKVTQDLEQNNKVVQKFTNKVTEATRELGLTLAPHSKQEEELESFVENPELDKLNLGLLKREFKEKEEKIKELERQVNKEAESMKNHLEEQMKEFVTRETILVENKDQIYSNLGCLDEKSEKSVKDCFEFVNDNLSEIFSMLLPGAMAKMNFVETVLRKDKDRQLKTKGIQMKIGFNGHWKESMSELSGGQRSLLALSFLLAMLRYRPAPFYILDEIDSAMDLSHTENIGYIISRFFPQSQFIVISLKGGLFNSSNVLFRTSLVDGRSQIMRYEIKKNREKKRIAEENDITKRETGNGAAEVRNGIDEEKSQNAGRKRNQNITQPSSSTGRAGRQ